MSLVEKTSKKLLPIYKELLKRAVQVKKLDKKYDVQNLYQQIEKEYDNKDSKRRASELSKSKEEKHKKSKLKKSIDTEIIDMRHILGYLNQSEWISSLNIGNIM